MHDTPTGVSRLYGVSMFELVYPLNTPYHSALTNTPSLISPTHPLNAGVSRPDGVSMSELLYEDDHVGQYVPGATMPKAVADKLRKVFLNHSTVTHLTVL